MKIIVEMTVSILFILSVTGYLIGSSGSTRFKNRLKYVSKPLMMPLLILLYLLFTRDVLYFIVIALTFGFLGDTFLLGSKSKAFFMAGLASFLLGHLCYIYGFLKPFSLIRNLSPWVYSALILYAFTGVFIYRKLSPHLGSMKLPATIYLCVIFIMSFSSFLRFFYYLDFRALLPLAGSILFISSDTALALDKFAGARPSKNFFKDITYVAAQVLITAGFTFI